MLSSDVVYYEYMTLNWKNIYKKHKGNWVAFANDEKTVLGSGKSAKQALIQARKKTNQTPILARMPQSLEAFVGAL